MGPMQEAMQAILETFSDSQDASGRISGQFETYSEVCHDGWVEECVEKFTEAELDFRTSGDRGLGRMTEFIPRFGGHCRKSLSSLSQQDLVILKTLIMDLILRGYLARVVLGEAGKAPNWSTAMDLYGDWIPNIYGGSVEELSEDVENALSKIAGPAFEELMSFIESRSIKAGGFFKQDKRADIFYHYPFAGWSLRAREVA
jgi:hypothetical protein